MTVRRHPAAAISRAALRARRRSSSTVPPHIEENIRSMAQIHAEHHQAATSVERAVDRTTVVLCNPWFLGGLTMAIAAWIGANLLALMAGYRALDPPPFAWLEAAVSLAALYMVVLILTSQRRADQLTERREQLTLELALLIEQKTTKVIRLLEEIRHDNPHIHNRVDHEAEAMAQPHDSRSVLDAIEQTHAAAEHGRDRDYGDSA